MLEDDLVEDPVFNHENDVRYLQSTKIDWSIQGTNNCFAVKDQGFCGSCWAFIAVSVMEAMISINKTATSGAYVAPVRLSEQQLVDCTSGTTQNVAQFGKNYGNFGCSGGWMSKSWNFVKDWGVQKNDDYPYLAVNGTCLYDAQKVVARTKSYARLTSTSTSLTRLQKGPLSITINGSSLVWRYYKSGFLTSADLCPTSPLDHAVMIVGYEVLPSGTKNCRTASIQENKDLRCADSGTY